MDPNPQQPVAVAVGGHPLGLRSVQESVPAGVWAVWEGAELRQLALM